MAFRDSDHEIEQRIGCSIRDFFAREGETRFRDLEAEVIDELTRGGSGVLSTGGGVVLREANRQHLRDRTRVVYLNSSPEIVSPTAPRPKSSVAASGKPARTIAGTAHPA